MNITKKKVKLSQSQCAVLCKTDTVLLYCIQCINLKMCFYQMCVHLGFSVGQPGSEHHPDSLIVHFLMTQCSLT